MDNTLFWSRLQFGFTITYHYLFPQLTMGLAWIIVYFRWRHLRSGDEVFGNAARFWSRSSSAARASRRRLRSRACEMTRVASSISVRGLAAANRFITTEEVLTKRTLFAAMAVFACMSPAASRADDQPVEVQIVDAMNKLFGAHPAVTEHPEAHLVAR